MRDALDQVTAELPRRAQRKPRPTIAQRRELVGYVPPKEVESCRTCRHLDARVHHPDTPYEREANGCKRHGFPVLLGAICDDYREGPGRMNCSQEALPEISGA